MPVPKKVPCSELYDVAWPGPVMLIYRVPRLCSDTRPSSPSARYDDMAGTPWETEWPVKLAVALGVKTEERRSKFFRSIASGKRPSVCWMPATSDAEGVAALQKRSAPGRRVVRARWVRRDLSMALLTAKAV